MPGCGMHTGPELAFSGRNRYKPTQNKLKTNKLQVTIKTKSTYGSFYATLLTSAKANSDATMVTTAISFLLS